MHINFDLQKINNSLNDFFNATGINIALFKSDFSYVCENRRHWEQNLYCRAIQNTKKGKETCRKSDIELLQKCRDSKCAQTHICPAGLVDVAIPILYNDEVIGYIMFGQMKPEKALSESHNYITSLGLDAKKMREYHEKIPYFDSDKIQSISNIAAMFIKYLLLENLLKPSVDKRIETVTAYINQNLNRTLSVQEISKNVNLSKSVLYRMFHNNFNCTISDYINQQRVEKSILYLSETDMSIDEISQAVGFAGASYYSRTFKKLKGISPLKFKKKSMLQL